MKAKTCHLTLRALVGVLTLCLTVSSVVADGAAGAPPVHSVTNAASQDADAYAAPAPPAAVNRRPSVDFQPGLLPSFSPEPTVAEIFGAQLFPQPLVPVGAPTVAENQALAAALTAYISRTNTADQSLLLQFLDHYPHSAWRPALLLNLGTFWREEGRFSKAIEAWTTAWNASKGAVDLQGKALADEVLCQLLQIHIWVGNNSQIESLMAEVGSRTVMGSATVALANARQALWNAQHRPDDGSKCGPYALQQLLTVTQTNGDVSKIFMARGMRHGFSLADLKQLAIESGMKYQMVRGTNASEAPTNSVVHWRLNHYGAILKKDGENYLIRDTAYNRIYGQELWVSQAALTEESDGYYLIPAGRLPKGWTPVGADEGKQVFGSGPPSGDDPNADGKKEVTPCPPPPNGQDTGDDDSDLSDSDNMAQATAHAMLISLEIVDTPLYYTPPVGPKVKFKITYHQKDGYSQVLPNYSNMGSKWSFAWGDYITDQAHGGAGIGINVNLYVSGGGTRTTYTQSTTPLQFMPDRDGGILSYIGVAGGPPVYQLAYPNGSKRIYGCPACGVPFFISSGLLTRTLKLHAIVDPAGNALIMNYDGLGRLAYVNDAVGQTTTLFYDLPEDPYKITRVQDPFGRTVSFSYDEEGRLHKSTDMIGIISAFDYKSGDLINALTTPYGTSQFTYAETPDGSYLDRSLLLTDPNGSRQYLIYSDNWPFPSSEPLPAAPGLAVGGNGFLNFRNTYCFDKNAMSQFAPGALPAPTDWPKATVFHWLHDNDYSGAVLCSGIMESLKLPLESRIWYAYPGQIGAAASGGITLRIPSVITRLVANAASPGNPSTQTYQYSFNTQGKVTQVIDPVGRKTTLTYYANGVDLQQVSQLNGAGSDVLAKYGTYNAQHRPGSFTDAAGQIYIPSWNSVGQLTQVVNPKGESTVLHYDATSRLQSVTKAGSGLTANNSFTFDSFNRVRTVTYLANFTASAENYTLTYNYDNIDRVTNIIYPDLTTEKFIYKLLDLAISYDRTGSRTVYTYDALRHPLTIKDRLNQITQFSWCGCDSLESITDPMGKVTSWTRDLEGRVTQKNYLGIPATPGYGNGQGIGLSTAYAYDAFSGRLQAVTDAKSQTKNYVYNIDDTLTNLTYTGAAIATPPVSFSWDPAYRRLVAMIDGNGTTTYAYYPVNAAPGAGQLQSEANTFLGSTITYTYDPLGRRISQSINGTAETKAFDALGRITSQANALGVFTPAYNFSGVTSFRPGQVTLPNNQASVFTYANAVGDEHLLEIKNLNPAASGLSKFDYQYDALSGITQWTKQADSGNPTVENFEYDYEGQLVNEVITPQGQTPTQAYTYAYDASGNRTSEEVDLAQVGASTNSIVTTSSYNAVNQLFNRTGTGNLPVRFEGTSSKPGTVTVNGQPATITVNPANTAGRIFTGPANVPAGYQTVPVTAVDLSGNTASQTHGVTVTSGAAKTYGYDNNGNCTNGGAASYQWDAADRLVAVNNGLLRSEFTYDGYGRRVQIVEKNNGAVTGTKRFVWVGLRLAEERSALNAVTRRFFGGGEQIAGVNYYYTRDHLGSVREMTDSSGTLHARYDYDPYGRLTKVSGDLDADFGYAGYYVHAPSNFYLTAFRAYDADSGRWLNRDPIGERGGINIYDYVANNPIGNIDFTGLWTFGIGLQFTGELALALGGSGGFYFGRNPDNGRWSAGFLFGPSVGGGGPISLGGGIFAQITNAKCVGQLKGFGVQIGASGGEGLTAGGDFVSSGDGSYVGGEGDIGPGIKVPFPGEVHSAITYTAGWDSDDGWKQ